MYIKPNWPVPSYIHAFTTTRRLVGKPHCGYDHFNLAQHVEDDSQQVTKNREQLCRELNLPCEPFWINQIHSNVALELAEVSTLMTHPPTADATFTFQANKVCVVLTADCLPILLFDPNTQGIAAVHAGWKGLANGIIQQVVNTMSKNTCSMLAWLGPAISRFHYEVGNDVYETLKQQNAHNSSAFTKFGDKWLLDLYKIATLQLNNLGVKNIYTEDFCTFRQKDLFYSYRRDGKKSGRMATVIWNSWAEPGKM